MLLVRQVQARRLDDMPLPTGRNSLPRKRDGKVLRQLWYVRFTRPQHRALLGFTFLALQGWL